eukprot:scaffold54920_cov33-Tisochrysis_lutea.AAC.5
MDDSSNASKHCIRALSTVLELPGCELAELQLIGLPASGLGKHGTVAAGKMGGMCLMPPRLMSRCSRAW